MARFAYGRHTAKVAIGSYPDDDSYPIGTNEWNEDINNLGMLGFTSVEGTCATNVVTLNVPLELKVCTLKLPSVVTVPPVATVNAAPEETEEAP